MGRLSRAQSQERNRASVLAAARSEFAERGFRDAKVDGIAQRAGLTRGAVYSNFPGKRALYFAVLADLAERAPTRAGAQEPSWAGAQEPSRTGSARPGPEGRPGPDRTGRTGAKSGPTRGEPTPTVPETGLVGVAPAAPDTLSAAEALGGFARAWVGRLPLADVGEPHGPARLGVHLLPEVLAEERIRRPFAQLMKLDAILLGLALERLGPPGTAPGGLVRVAEAVLTTLHGANQMAAAAPGFIEPFNVVSACERLAGLDLHGWWPPAHVITQALPVDAPWIPPAAPHALDAVRGEPALLADDGVVAVLGLHRLEAIEEAVRAAPPGARITAALVTGDPAELAPLARLAVAELCGCLRQAFPPSAWPRLQVVFDESGALAAAAGLPAVSDGTEAAVRIAAQRIVARADGRGACHAAASAVLSTPASTGGAGRD
ncbi:TetR/AcrR family transcriptional regulator [Streptomyces sp. GMY02]|uniref:TetR/AcrR family transcriptional regulator n=1 Tax=Streptomyces sp. GMY02 TaxID=1333528 RepID=UPI0020B817DB|nr:helix-turn-helix domain-containing protein [Streptomyces sp. GMY02]